VIRPLLNAEFRKIFTVNLWWALLLPVVGVSFFGGWLGTAIATLLGAGQRVDESLPIGLLTVSMATNFNTVFAATFGALAVSGEHRNKSITTTYLTGNPRIAILGTKLIAYLGVGVIYGLTNVLVASAGALVGTGFRQFGDLGDWSAVCGAGVLAMVLWTLLGVGFGTLIPQSTAAVVVLLGYRLVFESVLDTYLLGSLTTAWVTGYLPAASGNGIVGNLAVSTFVFALTGQPERFAPQAPVDALHLFFGGTYNHPWWLSLITFVGYTAVIVAGGWLVSRRRDIT
jgi:ABC-2 type transport system permease protein